MDKDIHVRLGQPTQSALVDVGKHKTRQHPTSVSIAGLDQQERQRHLDRIYRDPEFGPLNTYALQRLGDLRGKTVLEIGCGCGHMSAHFALLGARVIAIDTSEHELSLAKQRLSRFGVMESCQLLQCKAEELQVADHSVDVVYSRSTMQYVNREKAFSEFKRVLVPDGMLSLNENLPNNPVVMAYRCIRRLRAVKPEQKAYLASILGYINEKELEQLAREYTWSDHSEYHILRPLTIFISKYCCCKKGWVVVMDHCLKCVDDWLIQHIPATRRLAWFTSTFCSKPMQLSIPVEPSRGGPTPEKESHA